MSSRKGIGVYTPTPTKKSMMAATPVDSMMQCMTPMEMLNNQQHDKIDYTIIYAQMP
jgi:hypothetical protein